MSLCAAFRLFPLRIASHGFWQLLDGHLQGLDELYQLMT